MSRIIDSFQSPADLVNYFEAPINVHDEKAVQDFANSRAQVFDEIVEADPWDLQPRFHDDAFGLIKNQVIAKLVQRKDGAVLAQAMFQNLLQHGGGGNNPLREWGQKMRSPDLRPERQLVQLKDLIHLLPPPMLAEVDGAIGASSLLDEVVAKHADIAVPFHQKKLQLAVLGFSNSAQGMWDTEKAIRQEASKLTPAQAAEALSATPAGLAKTSIWHRSQVAQAFEHLENLSPTKEQAAELANALCGVRAPSSKEALGNLSEQALRARLDGAIILATDSSKSLEPAYREGGMANAEFLERCRQQFAKNVPRW